MSESYILPFIRNSVEEILGPEQTPARQNGSLNFLSLDRICVLATRLLQLVSPEKNKLLSRSQTNQVVYGLAEFLFATQVFFSSLDTDMPQQKLNLFQFTASKVTQAGACAP